MEWSGMEWSGVEWSGVEWSGVEWSGVNLRVRTAGPCFAGSAWPRGLPRLWRGCTDCH